MTAGRAAAGLTLALLLVGTAVHYRTAHPASGAFVSAAEVDADSLDPCPAAGQVVVGADAAARAAAVPAAADDTTGTTGVIVVAKKACGCGSAVCTAGRVCVKGPTGKGEDKCYLPRCKNDKAAAIPGDIYTAGCVCGGNDLFASSDPKFIINTAPAADPATATEVPACEAGKSKVDTCSCGIQVCKKGEVCDATAPSCDGADGDLLADYKALGLYVHAMPADLTDASKFAICKNTNSEGDEACDIDGEVKCVKIAA